MCRRREYNDVLMLGGVVLLMMTPPLAMEQNNVKMRTDYAYCTAAVEFLFWQQTLTEDRH